MTVESAHFDTVNSLGDVITAPGGSNSKGAWTQLIASVTNDCHGFAIATFFGGADADVLYDIGIGGSGSETVLVPNVYSYSVNSSFNQANWQYFPVAIAAGTRVSIRYQATSGSTGARASIYLFSGNADVPLQNCSIISVGPDTSDSGGVSIDPGGTANTKGSYTQITASTSADINYLAVNFGHANAGFGTTCHWLVDIATGGAGSESIIIPNLYTHGHTGHDKVCGIPNAFMFPVSIASGTRIAARAQCFTNSSPARLLDVTLLGYNATGGGGGDPVGEPFSVSFG